MATESTQLLIGASRKPRRSISSRVVDILGRSYKSSFFQSKGGTLVLVWISTFLMAAIMIIYSTPVLLVSFEQIIVSFGLLTIVYICFPLLGYLGEKFARHKLLLAGTILTAIGSVINIAVILLQATLNTAEETKSVILTARFAALLPGLCGYGLCFSNILQFGITQLQFAPSHVLEAYIRWLILASLSTGVLPQMLSVFTAQSVDKLLIINGAYLMVMILVGAIVYAARRQISLEAPPPMDPVVLIYKVMKYAWKHNHASSRRRSAFTCNDGPPSRLDLAKTRQGGPFTTQQVEDVKSFWFLLLIPLAHICNPALFITESLGNLCVKCLGKTTSDFQIIILKSSSAVTELFAVVSIIVLQLVIVPCCSKRIPNLLKRMWIGLFLLLTSALATTIISYNFIQSLQQTETNNSTGITCQERAWPYYVVIVPEVISGIGLSLSIISQLEFIIAQAPHSMKGILIGTTYIQFVFPYFTSSIGNVARVNENLYYYLFICFLQILVLTFYSIVAYNYKYRQPNELSDINVRATIEEIFARELRNNDNAQEGSSCYSSTASVVPIN